MFREENDEFFLVYLICDVYRPLFNGVKINFYVTTEETLHVEKKFFFFHDWNNSIFAIVRTSRMFSRLTLKGLEERFTLRGRPINRGTFTTQLTFDLAMSVTVFRRGIHCSSSTSTDGVNSAIFSQQIMGHTQPQTIHWPAESLLWILKM